MKKLLLLPVLLHGVFALTAQLHSDCAAALLICNKQSLLIDSVHGGGADITELNGAACFANAGLTNFESNSYWIRFTVAQTGTLHFTITPDAGDDLDFVLFQLADDGNCQQKQVLRCMAAGYSASGADSVCLGPTGLRPGETDIEEDAGCNETGDNNFLAPVDLQAGKTYALCVMNFSSLKGFRIDFCGSALLGCETTSCSEISTAETPQQPAFQIHKLYPNPVVDARLLIDLEMETPDMTAFSLVNLWGQTVRETRTFTPEGRQIQAFPVDHLPPGAYWLRVANGVEVRTRMIWIAGCTE